MRLSRSDYLWSCFGIGLVVLWLLIWELSVWLGLRRDLITPPSELIVLLYRSLFVTGELLHHLWASVTRLAVGFGIGAMPALWLGFVMGRNKRASLRYGPILAVLGLIPMVFALPWFILWFGVRDVGRWTIVGAAVFYPVLHCTIKGVRISRAWCNEGSSPTATVTRRDWTHSAGPWIVTGLKLGTIVGVATLFGAEMYASPTGLGFEVVVAGAKFEMARVYTAMFAAAFVVYAIWLLLTGIEIVLARRFAGKI